jgi:hypothetical protein
MKKNLTAVLTAATVLFAGAVFAQDEEELPVFSPIETFTCTYKDGMGPADLDDAVDAWNKWMESEDDHTYWAATLTPYYHGPDAFDFAWLGAWTSGAAMGAGTDKWLSEGGEYAANFDALADCDTHSGFAGTMLKEPPGDDEPASIVLTFQDCNITSDDPDVDLFGALNAWSEYATTRGYRNGSWVLFPVYGGGGAEFDFKLVNGNDNHTDVGTNWDLYAAGDYNKARELNGGVYECDDARMYIATVRRRIEDE